MKETQIVSARQRDVFHDIKMQDQIRKMQIHLLLKSGGIRYHMLLFVRGFDTRPVASILTLKNVNSYQLNLKGGNAHV